MSVRDELLKFRNSKKQILQEQSVYRNWPGVQPDKYDFRKPIPDTNILPDCFSHILKSETNMIAFNKRSLESETQKRVDGVDLLFDPNAPSSDLGITVMKDGKPFCFIKK